LLDQDGGEIELITVLEVFWSRSTESVFYSGKSITNEPQVRSTILNSGQLDAAVQVSMGGQSRSVPVVLDDTDGKLKTYYDTQDLQKVPVKVWIYLNGTDFATEKFSAFLGQINSPIVWKEGLRQLEFNIVNRIEDVTIGFSAEEGDFPTLPDDLIGKTWPLHFGTTRNVKCLRVVPAISGALQGGVGIKDFTLARRLVLAEEITCPQTPIGFQCTTTGSGISYSAQCSIAYEQDQGCLQSRCFEIERLTLQAAEQSQYEYNQITVFNGNKFPQDRTITLNIDGGLFTGYFNGTPQEPNNVFIIQSRQHPKYDSATGNVIVDALEEQVRSACPAGQEDAQDSNYVDSAFGDLYTGLRNSRISWEAYRREKAAGFFWARGGATVVMQDAKEIIYVANIIPSTILRVAAWRLLNGNRFLLTVPEEFYEVRQTDFNGYQVMEIVFQRPLSSEQDESGGGWSNDIYVSQESSVGPNTVDILEWIIETYTDYAIDSTSFNTVRSQIDNYPMHFPLLSRPGLLQILQDLARKARCALWQTEDTFFLTYLPIQPTPVATIGEYDILRDTQDVGTMEIELTKTESLKTEHIAEWRDDYAIEEPNKLILRHNVIRSKYGSHRVTEDYYPYVHLDIIRKSLTFWMIREANSWKRLKCQVTMKFAALEPFDAVTLDLPDIATDPVVGIVERAELDTTNMQINLEVWTPVKAGTMVPYNFAWPANLPEAALFPTLEERNASYAGSGTDPNFSVVAPPGHPLNVEQANIYSGMNLGCNGRGVTSLEPGICRQDHGDRAPSDTGDQKPTVDVNSDTTGDVSGGTSPISNGSGDGFFSNQESAKNQRDQTESAAGKAKETAESGGSNPTNTADKSEPVTKDSLNELPDPDDVKTECLVNVVAAGFPTEENPPGTCVPVNPPGIFTDIYSFDSVAAATGLCSSLTGQSSCGGIPPCGMCISTCSVQVVRCPEGSEGNGSLVGFRGGSSTHTLMTGTN
jgi:hypothetical protein